MLITISTNYKLYMLVVIGSFLISYLGDHSDMIIKH